MTLHFLVMLCEPKRKTSVSGQRRHGMTMTTKMAKVHQNHSQSLANGCQNRFQRSESRCYRNLGLSVFDNLDVVDDAGNVIAYTVSEEPVEGYEATIEGTNITNSRTPEVVEIQ